MDQLAESEDRPEWLDGEVRLSWGIAGSPHVPVLQLPGTPSSAKDVADFLATRLARVVEEHASGWAVSMLIAHQEKVKMVNASIRERCNLLSMDDRSKMAWVMALACESVPDAASQLQTVRRDYLVDNLKVVLRRTESDHLFRTLFATWDYADPLANQSLHWEPTEDRRHAYQWNRPSGDPTRNRLGGMFGANRLALEAWPLFPSFPGGADRLKTRGFKGKNSKNTFWTWPLWQQPLTKAGIASMLALSVLQNEEVDLKKLRGFGVSRAFRLQRILVGKTPNFTTAIGLA